MNITSVSNSSNSFTWLNIDNEIKLLEKQKMQLQEQIQRANESKLDEKTKQERVKQLQIQIEQIDMEIQQKRSEKINEKQDDTVKSVKSSSGNNDADGLTDMTNLIEADSTISNMRFLNYTKKGIKNNKRIIQTEIKLDEHSTPYKDKMLQSIDSNVKKIEERFGEEVKTANDRIGDAYESEREKDNDKINEDKLSATASEDQKVEEGNESNNDQVKREDYESVNSSFIRIDVKI